jgi:predicted ATPase
MAADFDRFFVLTGGPGSGKSTLLTGLREAGYAGSVEAGRGIIQDQVAIGGPALPWNDPALFSEQMLCWEMRSYRIAAESPGTTFFDRGVPDIVGYIRLTGLQVPDHVMQAAKTFRYNRRVFIFPPWPEIFAQDHERKQSLEEAERTFHAVAGAYADCGYDLIEVPRLSVDERVRFVIAAIGVK